MTLRSSRRSVHTLLFVLTFVAGGACATGMETVRIGPDKKGFVLHPSGDRYVPWGHNYSSVDIMERLADDPGRVEREFAEMKAAGTTVARIHPEMPRILIGPDKADSHALDQLGKLLKIAENSGIHLKITGLACYRIKDRMAWYDSLEEQDRWRTQAFFWETIARTCRESPAVFAYDLVNEPAAVGKRSGGWYTGRMGDVEFCQRLSLNPGTRNGDEIFREWTKRMIAAIRTHDRTHLITMGMLPFPGAYKTAAEQLDFVSPHLYPETGKVDDEIELLKRFAWGKPIVIGETFPLKCGADDERAFLLKSRDIARGWLGHWPDESPAKLAELKKNDKATIHNLIWLSWVELFEDIGSQMTGGTPDRGSSAPARRAETKSDAESHCVAVDTWFIDEVWAKVGARECIKCHKAGGDAEDTRFVLRDPSRAPQTEWKKLMRGNRDAFARMARLKSGDRSLLLMKVVGELDHGGEEVLERDSKGYGLLAEFLRRLNTSPPAATALHPSAASHEERPFFDGIVMVDERKLLRRATLSLAGRLPTDAELRAVANGGLKAVATALDAVMREEAFYERLREGFNDIFLTLGIDDAGANVLSYEHFEKTRHWYQKCDLSHIADEDERKRARWKLAREFRESLLGEPMALVDYIVRHDRPFTEIVTADYIMVSPYTARAYGVFDEVKERFTDADDPQEYVPVRLKALVGRSRREDQESITGFYPHAGLLSTFQYLSRYGTTETNRNRLRARMYFQHFLGVDVLELAARVSDAAAVTAKFENPTMEASECVVCHRTLDPVAGLFQDYWRFNPSLSIYGRREEGWFTDMFAAGFEGEELPAAERWRALAWLGERTVKDPRFAVAMVEHAYFILTGRRPLLPPEDFEDPLYAARRRAYREQRKQLETIASRFSKSGFNFKQIIKDCVLSEFYRADGLATVVETPERRAELNDVGVVRLLSPEQLERKIAAVFGKPWGRLREQTAMLYGGIDSKEVTERAIDPSGAMGAIQRTLANDVACRNVALDFSRRPDERLLFADVEPDVLPGASAASDVRIRRAIVRLHHRVLGRDDEPNSTEVDRTFELFAGIVADAAARKNLDPREAWHCRQGLEAPVPDPHYTVRAWRAVVTYLLRQQEFLYE